MDITLAEQALQPLISPFNESISSWNLQNNGISHLAMHLGRITSMSLVYDVWFVEYKAESSGAATPRLYFCWRDDCTQQQANSFYIDCIGFRRADYQQKAIDGRLTQDEVHLGLRGLDLLDAWAMRDCKLDLTYCIKA